MFRSLFASVTHLNGKLIIKIGIYFSDWLIDLLGYYYLEYYSHK